MEELLFKTYNVRVVGSGQETVVFAHGFGTDQSAWHRILPFFLQRYLVVLYDLACAGTVNPNLFDFNRYSTLDAYVDDLLNILDALRVRSCAFLGHSLAAMIGLLASIRRPELFTKLVLFGASARFLNDGEYHGGFEKSEMEEAYSCMESNYMAWVQGIAPLAVGADMPEAVQEFSRTLFNMRPDITLFASRMALNCDLRGILGLVTAPCHIIQTTKDSSVPTSATAYLQSHLGGRTTLEILRTEGHLPHLSAPAMVAPAIVRALAAP